MARGYSLDALVNEHCMKSRTNLNNANLGTLTGMDSVGGYTPQIHYRPTSRNYAVRNFRVWDFKTTPNQISTL